MIHDALTFIVSEINEHFRNKLRINEDKVVLSGLVKQDGGVAYHGENKVLLTLINIEKENTKNASPLPATNGSLNINLYILFSAYFSAGNYEESLRFISYIIGFFQYKNVFNRANTPALSDDIDRLTFEMTSIGTEQLNNIWACLGAKYMPSVIYKTRMLSFDESVVKEYRPSISGIESNNE